MKKLLLILIVISVLHIKAQTAGCTDPLAINYNSLSTINDGSCTYSNASISPTNTYSLPEIVNESSGLILWNDRIWTHNDDTDTNLYALNTNNPDSNEAVALIGTNNVDWEEMSQDENYIYIGDFGNNANGNRKDLQILKVKKSTLQTNNQEIETIKFSYSEQTNFTPTGSNNTDFDCEAMVVTTDKIFLFTKEWLSKKTSIYSLPKNPGNYVATYQSTYDVSGLITGAAFLESKNLLVLCGYSAQISPFLYLLYDFSGEQFFGGNKRKVALDLPLHQTEGIATSDGLNYFISNEKYDIITQELHKLDLTGYLGNYLATLSVDQVGISDKDPIFFPNPVSDTLTVKLRGNYDNGKYILYDLSGKTIIKGTLQHSNNEIYVGALDKGIYVLVIQDNTTIAKKIIKI